jgi:hypothetical protein
MIFSIEIEGFRQKARLVAGVHKTKVPAPITFAMDVS